MDKIRVTCEMEVTLKMIGGKCKPLILETLRQDNPETVWKTRSVQRENGIAKQ